MADLGGDTPRDEGLEKRIAKTVKAYHRFLDEEKYGKPRRAGFKEEGGRKSIENDVKAEIQRIKDGPAEGTQEAA